MSRLVVTMAAVLAACGPGTSRPVERAEPPADVDLDRPIDWGSSGVDWAQPPAPGEPNAWKVPDASSFELDNGMKVVVVPNRRLPLVSATLVIHGAGSVSDGEHHGLAALTADLLDEGTGALGPVELAAELERLGSYLQTGAEAEVATVSVEGLSSTFADALQLAANIARAPTLAQADFDRVRSDRLSSLRRRRDRARQVARLVLDQRIFGAHPFAHPTAGYDKTVAALRRDQVIELHRRVYVPANATLVVVGDITPDTARAAASQAFGSWHSDAAPAPPVAPLAATPQQPRLVVVDQPGASQSVVAIGRTMEAGRIGRGGADYPALTVANTMLGGSFTSRLNRRLREELGYTYGAGSGFWHARDGGSWQATTSLETSVTIDGLREASRLIESMRAEALPVEELDRAKQLMVRQLPGRFETNSRIAGSIAGLISEGIDPGWYRGYGERINQVTGDQAARAAREAWPADRLVVVVVGDLSKILDGLLGLGLGPALQVDHEGAVLRTHPPR